ncbi:MAG: di-trans,poly-cis-decaprenylcistransferase [Candidatus Magasanikbacteria bacterium]|nr:di-trans,poly-cis-decaprenylcistransferase [Candidatus Magasanikbacteria bacterium]
MSDKHKPTHVAIITDGNRRWATNQGLPKFVGHTQGAKNLKHLALCAIKHNIPYLTLWGMSTENLKRDADEVAYLFNLFGKVIEYLPDFEMYNVKLNIIGDMSRLPQDVQKRIQTVVEKTKNYSKLMLTIALVYGGRDEIVRATKKIIKAGLKPEDLNETSFAQFLDTAGLPDVDLTIRTGGQQRLSGYLPWQTTYAELYFTDVFFPAFDETEFEKSINWFEEQKRNFGK